jgi:hypothetical protein
MDHVTKNIDASTRMVDSIENMINLSKTSADFKTTIENEKSRFKNRVLDLNKKSIRIYHNLKRKDIYSAYYDNAVKDIHDNVMLMISSNPNEKEIDYVSLITPSAYWLAGLHSFKTYQYSDCRKWLDKSIRRGLESSADNEREDNDFPLIFPDENGILTQSGGRTGWIKIILNQSYFIYGLLECNQGKYKEASEKFSKANEFMQHDFESKLLNLQSIYFSEEGNFDSILSRTDALKIAIASFPMPENVDESYRTFLEDKLNILNGYFYFPLKNKLVKNPFGLSRDTNKAFKVFKDLVSRGYYRNNVDMTPLIYYLHNISIPFTYCQVLKELKDKTSGSFTGPSRSEYESKIKELNEEIISLGNIVLQNTDKENPELNFYVNYIVALAFRELNPASQDQRYFSEMKSCLKTFENVHNFKVYSPYSKTFLSYPLLQQEVTTVFTQS